MNRYDIPNRIKQPSFCCSHCGKGYKREFDYHRHWIQCELIHNSTKKTKQNTKEEIIPTNKEMWESLIKMKTEDRVKIKNLEEKIKELEKRIDSKEGGYTKKQIKKPDIVEWLNESIPSSEVTFMEYAHKIDINDSDIAFLENNSVINALENLISRDNKNDSLKPISAFVEKPNTLYEFNEDRKWRELSKERFKYLVNNLWANLSKYYSKWEKKQRATGNKGDSFEDKCSNIIIKLYKVDFAKQSTLTELYNKVYHIMKREISHEEI